MRVLWLSHVVPYPPKAGVLLRAHYLLKSLASQHQVELVAFVQRPLLNTFYPDITTALNDCRKELLRFCHSVTFLPITKADRRFGKLRTALEGLLYPYGYLASWLNSSSARSEIRHIVRGPKFDLAHFDHISLASYRFLLADTPVTLGHHNAESHMLKRRAELESNPLKKVYFWQEAVRLARYETKIANWFRLHVTCSDLDSERLRVTMPSARMRVIPNGVDTAFFAPRGTPEVPNSLIFVGTLSWYPNFEAVAYLLREVWPRLRERIPTATFAVVGSGAPATLRELVAVSPGVTLHGYVPDVRPLIDSAALYVCPIRDGGGTKLKILDALAMAKCILAHPVACEGIDVTPGKDVILSETPDDFIRQIEEILTDTRRRLAIGRSGRELAESKYSFATIGTTFVETLMDACKNEL
jgi:glycosyltransferase involved in cell wall biosynthesis